MEKRFYFDENNFNNMNTRMERMESGLAGSSRKLMSKLNLLDAMGSLPKTANKI